MQTLYFQMLDFRYTHYYKLLISYASIQVRKQNHTGWTGKWEHPTQ